MPHSFLFSPSLEQINWTAYHFPWSTSASSSCQGSALQHLFDQQSVYIQGALLGRIPPARCLTSLKVLHPCLVAMGINQGKRKKARSV